MESLSNLDKILQDNRQDPMQSYKILQYYRQDYMKSYRILHYPRGSYKIVQDPMGWVLNLRQARKDSTAFFKNLRRSYRISQDPRQNPIKWLLILVKILWDLR